ncbi:MAG TPA: ABC transporter ATP-binding protein [Sandaracinaceae bacterium]
MSEPALEARGVEKRYRDGDRAIAAVAGVTLTIPRGTLTVLRGPSGSGKTTLLGLLGAMIAPTKGSIAVLGKDVTHLRDHHRTELRRRSIGFVFQQLSLVDRMTLRENVLLPLVPLGGATKAQRERARALLERFGLADRESSPPERLSGGERQRAAIARALVLSPPVLLLDEPTAHLDTENALAVVSLLAELRDEGTTVVAATHDPRLADDGRVDRVLAMRDGKLVEGG